MTLPGPDTPLIRWSWIGTAAFVVTSVAAAIQPSGFNIPALVVALILFAVGIVTMLWAFAIAVNRSRVDAIGVGGLFFGAGSTPRIVRWHILGALTIQTVAGIATASVRPFTSLAFGTLVPIFGIGMMGLWTARNGEFEPTDDPPPAQDTDDGDDVDDATAGDADEEE
ncbi:MAG: hypothetical protein AAGA90_16765 [Actinomycetota bacterium]